MQDSVHFDPPVGVPETVGHNIKRILAPNPSPMTFRGTNTYLLGKHSLAVIDPGPDDPAHLAAILNAVPPGGEITHIFVTHSHIDHSPLARHLATKTGAPVLAYGVSTAGRSMVMQRLAEDGLIGGGEGVDEEFEPDIFLSDLQVIRGEDWSITALWTPGHFGNHMCFAAGDELFCGDLVMGWASSLVSPPDGDLSDFMTSCTRLRDANLRILHSGHGAPITDPAARLDWLIGHRQTRTQAILDALTATSATIPELTRQIYTDTPPALLPAAERNVLAHLVDLTTKNQVTASPTLRHDALFSRI